MGPQLGVPAYTRGAGGFSMILNIVDDTVDDDDLLPWMCWERVPFRKQEVGFW
ncbi:hypothetical protein TorRG33x02_312990 [Trema orientale]|uniref:Uncharacterized protein n=1 Tax=Trema orientale TaxID=63057 RepID=A0A2P5BPS0_TREOI|nr:hypothetical protein TorRG33x02_312990 [Trema orientale]